jgi:hypothetical protein
MKTFIIILLFGLLGFLGCSGSNDETSATVGEATPVAPWAIIETSTPTYEWTPVQGATKYRLVVQNTNQAPYIHDPNETSIIDGWYTTEEAGCASEDGLCMVTPETEVLDENIWKVLACANQECGMWGGPMEFALAPPTSAGAPRFIDNGDDTVTDNNTKLMWTKSAGAGDGHFDYWKSVDYCDGLELAHHNDWRLPPLSELKSLVDKSQKHPPTLPPGHPFTNVLLVPGYFTTTNYYNLDAVWSVDFKYGFSGGGLEVGLDGSTWCDRSP